MPDEDVLCASGGEEADEGCGEGCSCYGAEDWHPVEVTMPANKAMPHAVAIVSQPANGYIYHG